MEVLILNGTYLWILKMELRSFMEVFTIWRFNWLWYLKEEPLLEVSYTYLFSSWDFPILSSICVMWVYMISMGCSFPRFKQCRSISLILAFIFSKSIQLQKNVFCCPAQPKMPEGDLKEKKKKTLPQLSFQSNQ